MAQGRVNCICEKCGETFTKIKGNFANRATANSWEEWAKDYYTVCPDCFKQQQAETAKARNEENSMPELEGTERQVAWAEEIRADVFKNTKNNLEKAFADADMWVEEHKNDETAQAQIQSIKQQKTLLHERLEMLRNITRASFWIDNQDTHWNPLLLDKVVKETEKQEKAQAEPERITYTTLRVPYGYAKGTYYKRVEDSYDQDTKTIEIRVAADDEAKVREAAVAYEQAMEAEKRKKEAEQKERESRIVSVKYKDLRNNVWKGKLVEDFPGYFDSKPKTVRDSYDNATKTIKVYAVSQEVKAEIEAYYAEKKRKYEAIPQEVRDFKDGLTSEYTITPPTLNADDIDNDVPEELRNET